jgi:hypothetical protein
VISDGDKTQGCEDAAVQGCSAVSVNVLEKKANSIFNPEQKYSHTLEHSEGT